MRTTPSGDAVRSLKSGDSGPKRPSNEWVESEDVEWMNRVNPGPPGEAFERFREKGGFLFQGTQGPAG